MTLPGAGHEEVSHWYRVLGDEDELTEADHRFLDVVRERAAADDWRCEMVDTFAWMGARGVRGNSRASTEPAAAAWKRRPATS
jgi:hypothetical protein